MKQKITWMLLLVIGILSSLQSCDPGTEYPPTTYLDFIYVNKSDYEIVIESFSYYGKKHTYNIDEGSAFLQQCSFPGNEDGIIVFSDSLVVEFGGVRRMVYSKRPRSQFGPLDFVNYEAIQVAENLAEIAEIAEIAEDLAKNRTTLIYYFSNEDFENALNIE